MKIFGTKVFVLTVTKSQKELLEFFMRNKAEFDEWVREQPSSKIKFQFYYPSAVDFYYSEFKLFTAYYKKGVLGQLELLELKMTETNYDSIRSSNWQPFEEVIVEFLTTLEESKKIALFEKRKTLYEYETLCAKKSPAENKEESTYLNPLSPSPLPSLKPTS